MLVLIIAISLCAAVIAATLYFATKMSNSTVKKMNECINNLAGRLGLQVIEHKEKQLSAFYTTELNGEVENRKFYFRSFTRSVQTSESFTTEFSLFCDLKEQHQLQITKESVVATLQKQFGIEDVEIGDKKFDDKFLIKCDNVEYAKSILKPEICAELIKREKIIFGSIFIRNKEIHYEESGVLATESDVDRIYRLIQLCKMICIQTEM